MNKIKEFFKPITTVKEFKGIKYTYTTFNLKANIILCILQLLLLLLMFKLLHILF